MKGSSFATGLEIQDKRKRVLSISTGSKAVDAILGGGVMSQSITEGTSCLRMMLHAKTCVFVPSIWRVQDGKDSNGAYNERCSPASLRHGWCAREGCIY
jgi:hypothetical protein